MLMSTTGEDNYHTARQKLNQIRQRSILN